jgi:FlaG/FlaF family flagellin (archaellin)
MESLIKLVAILAIGLNAYADTIMSVEPLFSGPTTVGSTVTLNVDLNSDSEDIAGFNFSVSFPSNLLQAADVTELGFFSSEGCCFGFSIDNSQGTIGSISDFVFGDTTDIASPTSPDTLVSLQFDAVASGVATIELTCAQGDTLPCNTYPILWDDDFSSIPATLNPAEVTITPGSTGTAPEPTTAGPILLTLLLGGFVRRSNAAPRSLLKNLVSTDSPDAESAACGAKSESKRPFSTSS